MIRIVAHCLWELYVVVYGRLGCLKMKTGGETFLAFNARAMPLAVLFVALLGGALWFIPPPYEGSFHVFKLHSGLFYAGLFYFAFLMEWLVERIRKAKGRTGQESARSSFRALNLRAIPVALAVGGLACFIMLQVSSKPLAWSMWATVLGVGAVIYSLFVLEWLSHRVYRVAARKLHPQH